jgi:hypothetical protein
MCLQRCFERALHLGALALACLIALPTCTYADSSAAVRSRTSTTRADGRTHRSGTSLCIHAAAIERTVHHSPMTASASAKGASLRPRSLTTSCLTVETLCCSGTRPTDRACASSVTTARVSVSDTRSPDDQATVDAVVAKFSRLSSSGYVARRTQGGGSNLGRPSLSTRRPARARTPSANEFPGYRGPIRLTGVIVG